MDDTTDEALVERVKQGDVLAFETIVRRYQKRLFSFVLHIVHASHIAEEVTQDALFSAYKTIDRIDTKKKFSSYVFTIAKNAAISRFRQQKNHVPIKEVEETLSEDETIYESIIQAEQQQMVQKAMTQLEEKYRTVISLYYFDDLSYEEISKTLHLPVNTVRTRLSRAKKLLREIL